MQKQIIELLQHNWVQIASIISLWKWVYHFRLWNFRWLIFITDIFFSLPMWWIAWELTVDLNIWIIFKIIFVVYISANAFVWTSIIFNPDTAKEFFIFIKKVFVKSIENKYNIKLTEDEKQDKTK